jgi:23S rRNA pseudoU1915 N3-methylase RlmH
MNDFKPSEAAKFERLLKMESGLVLNFSDSSFGTFFGSVADINIHDQKYCDLGTSKAKKLRSFWKQSDDPLLGKVLEELVNCAAEVPSNAAQTELLEECRKIARRLQGNNLSFTHLRETVEVFNSAYLSKQIQRMEQAVEEDPDLAIGTAKELVESCCKTILQERGESLPGKPDVSALTKATLKALDLVPEAVPDAARGKDVIKRILHNLAQIGNNLAELRGLYGTGHGKDHKATGLQARHAKLAVGSAATLATFLFETHKAK